MNKKQLKIANEITKTSSDNLELAHRSLTNTLAFLERSPIQGIKSIELLVESFNFILALREQVEKDMAKAARPEEASEQTQEEVASEEVPKQA